MSTWHIVQAWFDGALLGLASPWVIAVVLALTTLLLEDLAIAAGVALATQQVITWPASFAAVAGGIALGDLGLYLAGWAVARVPRWRRHLSGDPGRWAERHLNRRLPSAVLLARVIPGLRLVTYTACGFVRVPLAPFCGWVVLAVTLWTAGLYVLSASFGAALTRLTGLPPVIAVMLPIVMLALLAPLFQRRAHTSQP